MDPRFDLLPASMKSAIEGLQELHNTPDSMAIVCVLGVANLATSRLYNIDSGKYGVRPTSLFLLNLAPTGGRKSTNFREVTEGLRRFEEIAQQQLINEPVRYSIDEKRYKAKLKEYERELLEDEFATPTVPTPPRPVETTDYQLTTGTRNGIIAALQSQCFAGLLSSEAGEFFSGHSFKDQKSAVELVAFLTNLWDGQRVKKQTGMETITLSNKRLSMAFLLQEEVFQDIMNTPVFSEQGFMHRLLITQSHKYDKREWSLDPAVAEREEQSRSKLSAFNDTVFDLMLHPHRQITGRHFELDPEIMTLNSDAQQVLVDFYNATITHSESVLKNYAGFGERLHEHALRLAATIAGYERSSTVSKSHAECAVSLMDYFIEQRRRLEIGVLDRDPTRSTGSRRLYEWMVEKGFSGTKRKLSQFGPTWFVKLNSDQKDEILGDLLAEEWAIAETVTARNGRKTTVFSINRD